MKKIINFLWIIGGFISLFFAGFGIIATFIPFLPFPATPFLLLSSYCFAKGSKHFDRWFRSTKVYEKYLSDYVKTRSMTKKQKQTILCIASIGLIIPFLIVDSWAVRSVLILVAISKYAFFFFLIDTIKE